MPPHTDSGGSFVLGLDGAPWELIASWARSGALPNFATLFRDGASGPLQSTIPPYTAPAWPSIATGTRPDKHGIYYFRRLESDYTNAVNTSAEVERPTLWEICRRSVVANVPMTYPAKAIDGKMVTGMMSPSLDGDSTHPTGLATEIERRIPGYEIGLRWYEYHGREAEFLDDIDGLLSARRQLMEMLMETSEWDLFFFVYTEPDRLQHLIWDDDVLLSHYESIDDILGSVMEYVDERDGNLFVLSDHGFGPLTGYVHVNTLLEREGLLRSREATGVRGALEKARISKATVETPLQRLGLYEYLVRTLPDGVVDTVASRVPGDHGLYDVDFSRTKAFVHGRGNVYVNDTRRFSEGTVDPEDVEDVKRDVMTTLAGAADADDGVPALSVHDGDELFPTDPDSPDLVVVATGEYEVEPSLAETTVTDADGKAAAHRSDGIFLAWGRDIEAGASIEDASVFDVAPTVLHSLLLPVPESADGDVLLSVFADDSDPGTEPVSTASYGRADPVEEYDDDFEGVEGRLRGLGYIE